MGELHVHMNITLDGVIQANGGPSVQDGDYSTPAGSAHTGIRSPASR